MPDVFVAKAAEFTDGDRRIVAHDGVEIGVFNWQGHYYAYENLCIHQGGPACEGVIMHKVEDVLGPDRTWHGHKFSENEAHFADLRKALQINEWDIYGLSYGTDLALSTMRDYPQGIRSVIIDAVVPPSAASLGWTWTNYNEAIHNIFRACASQPTCASTYGDLSQVVQSQVQKLEATRAEITLKEHFGNVDVVIDGGALINWLGELSRSRCRDS